MDRDTTSETLLEMAAARAGRYRAGISERSAATRWATTRRRFSSVRITLTSGCCGSPPGGSK